MSELDLRSDPRISNERPGWLTDDQQWRDQLQAMDRDDCRWIEKHWDMAGGRGPAVDTSWVTMETVGGGPTWPYIALVLVAAFAIAVIAVAMAAR